MCHKNNMLKVTSNSIEKGTEHQLLVDDCVPKEGRAREKKQFHFIDFKSCLWNGGANFMDGMWHRLKIGWHFIFRSSPSLGRSLVFSVCFFFMKKIFLAIFSVKMWSHCRIYNGTKFNEPENVFIDKMQSDRENSFGWLKIGLFSPSVFLLYVANGIQWHYLKFNARFSENSVNNATNKHRTQANLHQNHTPTHTTQRHQRLMPNCISLISLHRFSHSLFHSISHWLNAFFSFTSFNTEQLNP